MKPMTEEEFKKALPDKMQKRVTKDLITTINKTLAEPEFYEEFRNSLISYTGILNDGRFKIKEYINAVKYVSYKLMGKTNGDAYALVFPDRVQRLVDAGKQPKDISSVVSLYNKSKLVNSIMEQALVPSWVLNQDLYQKALNTQAELMITARSEKVRSDAANSLLNHLKRPETNKIELQVGHKEDSSISELRNATLELVKQQRLMMEAGQMTANEAAKSKIAIEGEYTEVHD